MKNKILVNHRCCEVPMVIFLKIILLFPNNALFIYRNNNKNKKIINYEKV